MTKRQLEDATRCKSKEACMQCRAWSIEYDGMDDCIEKLAQTALAYRELAEKQRLVLERLEWMGYGMAVGVRCPICYNREEEGHEEGCELAALLRESAGYVDEEESEVEYTAECCEGCPCANYCGGAIIEVCMDDWKKRKQGEIEVEEE